MRLLVLNYEFPPLGGGAANAAENLAHQWGKAGRAVDVITTWYEGLSQKERRGDTVCIYRVKSPRRRRERSNLFEMMGYIVWALPKALLLSRAYRYDLTISFFAIPSGIVALTLTWLRNIPYIVLLRGGDVPGFLGKKLAFYHIVSRPINDIVWKKAHRIIANSRGLAHLASQTSRRLGKIVIAIPNGVDTEFFTPPQHERSLRPCTFLFVGRFYFQKNLPLLIEQFVRCVNKTRVSAELYLVGDGPERDTILKRIHACGPHAPPITVERWASKKELVGWYQRAAFFINPSLDEGMPNTVLEAFACGVPVIASDIAGHNELVEHGVNGYLFPLEKPDMLGDLIEKAAADSDILSMGRRAREKVTKHYSWKIVSEAILTSTEVRHACT